MPISLRLTPELKERAMREAKKQRRTLSNYIRCLIEDELKRVPS